MSDCYDKIELTEGYLHLWSNSTEFIALITIIEFRSEILQNIIGCAYITIVIIATPLFIT